MGSKLSSQLVAYVIATVALRLTCSNSGRKRLVRELQRGRACEMPVFTSAQHGSCRREYCRHNSTAREMPGLLAHQMLRARSAAINVNTAF
jgi:hypothetical protein